MLRRRHRAVRATATVLVGSLLAAFALAACGSTAPLPRGHAVVSILEDKAIFSDPAGSLAELKALGVQVARVSVAWDAVAPDPTSRQEPAFAASDPAAYPAANWTIFDTIVRDAAADHIGVDFTADAPPPLWAQGPGVPRRAPDAAQWRPNADEFGQFMTALGTRYSGRYTPPGAQSPLPRVSFWGIWNEPNYGPYLAPQAIDHSRVEVSPMLYRRLLDAAWRALLATAHTPRTDTILIGETAPRGIVTGNNPADFQGMVPLRFVRALYCVDQGFHPLRGRAASERGCPSTAAATRRFPQENPALFRASGFADHPYPDEESPTQKTPNVPGDAQFADFASLPSLERTLDRAAAAYGSHVGLPIYNTEYGYQTDPPSPVAGVPLRTAAAYLNESEYLSWRSPRIRSYDQYLLADPPGTSFVTGLEFANGQPKPPVFDAYRMPLWLPQTHASAGAPLLVWGCVRPAPNIVRSTRSPQRVSIQLNSGPHGFRTVRTVTLHSDTDCYFATRVVFPRSGAVRLAWSDSGEELHSRTQAITVS